MDKLLKLKIYVDGVNDTPFPQGAEEPIEIGAFRYDAKRMGGAPTITATVSYPTCLDKEWNDLVYTVLNGEKYFLKQTPTSTLSNEDARYKHDLVMVAERVILDEAYFFDAVVGNPLENDKPVTNSTNFNFYGSIEEFVKRMNASLQYTKLQSVSEDGVISGYRVILDDDVVTREQKQVVFDGAAFSQALQECYNTFGIPFYFDGKEIHVGYTNNVISDILEYGVDGALLSASKQNANFKVVNRATGTGSTDNIPYYYPNNAPKGEIGIEVNTTSEDFDVKIEDYESFSNNVKLDTSIVRVVPDYTIGDIEYYTRDSNGNSSDRQHYILGDTAVTRRVPRNDACTFYFIVDIPTVGAGEIGVKANVDNIYAKEEDSDKDVNISAYILTLTPQYESNGSWWDLKARKEGDVVFCEIPSSELKVRFLCNVHVRTSGYGYVAYYAYLSLSLEKIIAQKQWEYDGTPILLEDFGLSATGYFNIGDTITQRLIQYTKTATNLQPSIYRATKGAERFYNAINYPFVPTDGYELKYGEYIKDGEVHNDAYKKDNGEYYEFTNEYKEARPREHVFTVDDIKPTIKEMTNDISWSDTDSEGNPITVFQRIDMFSEFAYDKGDNDETYIDENGEPSFKHPYFFAKLRKLDFNLFDCAIEQQPMTISMTAGHCGACNFEIGVSEDYPQSHFIMMNLFGRCW